METGDAYTARFAVVARDSKLRIAVPSTSTDGKYLSWNDNCFRYVEIHDLPYGEAAHW